MNYPNPCDRCTECTVSGGCDLWKTRFLWYWKQFNGYPVRVYHGQKVTKEKFVYEHPDIIRRYLEKGPCENCQRKDTCEAPCPAYWRWWDERMEMVIIPLWKGR